jgi:translation elongation factor EF-G
VGEITLEVSPNPRGGATRLRIEASEEEIPGGITIETAIEEGLSSGVVLGYPVLDVKVQVVGGKFTPGLSTRWASAWPAALRRAQGAKSGESVLWSR